MCQQHHDNQDTASRPDVPTYNDPFPWSEGVFDAHCHPTDTLSSLTDIPNMKASVLTIMSTRSQDQALVAHAAASPLGLSSRDKLLSQAKGASIVPCFGWHPWFSHQLYDDSGPRDEWTYQPPVTDNDEQRQAAKLAHYAAVLQPSPGPDDKAFLDSLPEPRPLSSFINDTRARLEEHPLALVGEVGLDKAFRLPEAFDESSARDSTLTPGTRDGRLLSPHHVKMQHQIVILKAQLALAAELGRAASVHGVQAHGILYDTLVSTWKGHEKEVLSRRERRRIAPGAEDFSSSEEEDDGNGYSRPKRLPCGRRRVAPAPFAPRICLHSFSGADQMMKQYLNPAIPARIYFSFSQAINLSEKNGTEKFAALMKACPDDRILVESDLHIAGAQMDDALEAMYREVCRIKGWELEEGVRLIRRNYEEFLFG
ncbi:Cut9-interacting protein scn1 [Plectosphaerella plurivora]|uniref:Cut9-interacting protein scn1 n=1 Tax=Plectosphaerella plurivora TaxID=936078 RepID=A0A9P8V4W4_9PEZI|nr:Cut9-interacting protein scn1 [Plectosphaerella plurivora]